MIHPLNNGTGFSRAWKAFNCSLKGFVAAVKHESAFRQELGLACIFLPTGIWIGEDLTQKILLCVLVFIVLIVELLNSAIEATVDRVGLENHELSGRAKDLASAAVMLSLCITGGSYALVAIAKFT
jgi:diacylglycerol kinase (ATP)